MRIRRDRIPISRQFAQRNAARQKHPFAALVLQLAVHCAGDCVNEGGDGVRREMNNE
jgi:hypothetical protein